MNSFNCIRIEAGLMTIERRTWSLDRMAFEPGGSETYRKTADGWEPHGI
jgi:hypothetical protein